MNFCVTQKGEFNGKECVVGMSFKQKGRRKEQRWEEGSLFEGKGMLSLARC